MCGEVGDLEVTEGTMASRLWVWACPSLDDLEILKLGLQLALFARLGRPNPQTNIPTWRKMVKTSGQAQLAEADAVNFEIRVVKIKARCAT